MAVLVGTVAPVFANGEFPRHGPGLGVKGILTAVDTAGRTITVHGQQYSLSADVRIGAACSQITSNADQYARRNRARHLSSDIDLLDVAKSERGGVSTPPLNQLHVGLFR